MANVETQATIEVGIDGLDDLKTTVQTLKDIKNSARPKRSPSARAGDNYATQFGENIATEAAAGLKSAVTMQPISPLQAVTQIASSGMSAIRSLGNAIGSIATTSLAAGAFAPVAAIAGFGALALAVRYVALPLFGLGAAFKILRTTYNMAAEGTESGLAKIAEAKRTFPTLVGKPLQDAISKTKVKTMTAAALFGDAAEDMQTNISRRWTDVAMRRGLRGDRGIFERWGIPQAMAIAEQNGERLDINDWLRHFLQIKAKMDAAYLRNKGTPAGDKLKRQRGMLFEDAVKLFGQDFADILGIMTVEDHKRLELRMAQAANIGRATSPNAQREIKDHAIAMGTTRAIFFNLKNSIAEDLKPLMIGMMDDVFVWFTKVGSDGFAMSDHLRRLASAIAIKSWQTLQALLSRFNTKRVQKLVQTVAKWHPADAIKNIVDAIPNIKLFGKAILIFGKTLWWAWKLFTPAGQKVLALETGYKTGRRMRNIMEFAQDAWRNGWAEANRHNPEMMQSWILDHIFGKQQQEPTSFPPAFPPSITTGSFSPASMLPSLPTVPSPTVTPAAVLQHRATQASESRTSRPPGDLSPVARGADPFKGGGGDTGGKGAAGSWEGGGGGTAEGGASAPSAAPSAPAASAAPSAPSAPSAAPSAPTGEGGAPAEGAAPAASEAPAAAPSAPATDAAAPDAATPKGASGSWGDEQKGAGASGSWEAAGDTAPVVDAAKAGIEAGAQAAEGAAPGVNLNVAQPGATPPTEGDSTPADQTPQVAVPDTEQQQQQQAGAGGEQQPINVPTVDAAPTNSQLGQIVGDAVGEAVGSKGGDTDAGRAAGQAAGNLVGGTEGEAAGADAGAQGAEAAQEKQPPAPIVDAAPKFQVTSGPALAPLEGTNIQKALPKNLQQFSNSPTFVAAYREFQKSAAAGKPQPLNEFNKQLYQEKQDVDTAVHEGIHMLTAAREGQFFTPQGYVQTVKGTPDVFYTDDKGRRITEDNKLIPPETILPAPAQVLKGFGDIPGTRVKTQIYKSYWGGGPKQGSAQDYGGLLNELNAYTNDAAMRKEIVGDAKDLGVIQNGLIGHMAAISEYANKLNPRQRQQFKEQHGGQIKQLWDRAQAVIKSYPAGGDETRDAPERKETQFYRNYLSNPANTAAIQDVMTGRGATGTPPTGFHGENFPETQVINARVAGGKVTRVNVGDSVADSVADVAKKTRSLRAVLDKQEEQQQTRLEQPAPPQVLQDDTAAGVAAARAFREGLAGVRIPVKMLSDAEQERYRRRNQKESEQIVY